jgi:hypothetical protein
LKFFRLFVKFGDDPVLKRVVAGMSFVVFFVVLGVVVFPLKDLLTGNLFSLWIDDRATALLASAIMGAVIGLLLGSYFVRKSGARFFATFDEVEAAFKAKKARSPTESSGNPP